MTDLVWDLRWNLQLPTFFLENKTLQNNAEFHPKLYLRYFDDIFCMLSSETSSNKFLGMLNKQYKNIKFTAKHRSEKN